MTDTAPTTRAMAAWQKESGINLPPTRAELLAEVERLRAALRDACRAAEVETTDHAIQIIEKALSNG